MSPLPQKRKIQISNPQNDGLTGEEVVISGISGQFAMSQNVMEFMDNLYNKVDMVTKYKPIFEHALLSQYKGKISDVEKFDAQFFRVTHAQADSLDPISRKLMEHAYGALYDAGVNPLLCKGKKIGVFAAAYNIESCKHVTSNHTNNNFMISGSCKTMHANRISYWLDAKGPSFTIDSPSGSIIALEHALNCIKSGLCEAAIVGSGELPNDPILNINMTNAGIFSVDGKSRCFDKKGDGTAISEAVGVLFLQKAKDAKRIYAEICGAGFEYGLKAGLNFSQNRDPNQIVKFIKKVYSESGLQPHKVEYVEAHGAAHPEADANELKAIAQVFGEKESVLVGCVKSNMGDTQPVSGICAITKLCLAYHKGKLPGNLHYNDPLDIPVIKSEKVKVLTDNKVFNRGTTAVNNFSHTGTNCHIVLKGHYKPKDLNRYNIDIPRLVLVFGRHEKGVEKVFHSLENQPIDPELIGMLNNIYQVETPGFTCRGYIILDTKDDKTICLSKSTELNQDAAPPLWLLYSGMGSQWAGMGTELMRIPLFAAAIDKCHKILSPKGVDLKKIITSPDKTIFDNVLNCFIGIAAVQIGLTNILKELGLVADNIIGHSVGELGCGYYDGCLTDEEMILTAHARGLVSIQTKLIKGSMAAVGLGYNEMLQLCPPSIEIACRNSSTVCTISGPADDMKTFVAALTAKGIFAKEVPCGNIAYHSRYIQDAGPQFLERLKRIIKNPIKRSKNWISTSWPDGKRDEKLAEMCSAEYHQNNLLSPVYFEEAAKLIPVNAVVVEVAPHCLMQAIMKRSHPKCTHVPLTRRGHSDPLQFLFEAFGKLYEMGYNLKVNTIYPKIEYPVSTETSPLSHLVKWYHEEDWFLTLTNKSMDMRTAASRKVVISMDDDDYKFLAGYRREGNLIVPEAVLLFHVWETLAMYEEVHHTEISIAFYDVNFHAEVIFDVEESVHLKISINKGDHYFEVTRSDVKIASGYINTLSFNHRSDSFKESNMSETLQSIEENNEDYNLNTDDVYKIFKLKGYCYEHDFQMIHSIYQRNLAKIKTSVNWIPFIDSLIQFNILVRDYNGLSLPKIIKSLTIDMTEHNYRLSKMDKENCFIIAHFDKHCGVTKCGGVKIADIIFYDKPIIEALPDVLETTTSPTRNTSEIKEFKLVNYKRGDIDSMEWEEVENQLNTDKTVQVYYAAPSLRDVQNAAGIGEIKGSYGMDFSGIDSKGNRVMGLVAEGALATSVEPDYDLLWPVPQHWSLEEAATVLLPYVHAFYCLLIRGKLEKGQTVFITGGAGALGQAVISICLSLGCNVYTSVRNAYKKQFLMELFPKLNENHIGFSRDSSFYNMVVHNSKNTLCDYVINCSTGFDRELAMKCVGFNGHFLDATDYDIRHNRQFGMSYLWGAKSYAAVDVSQLFKSNNIKEKKLLHKMVGEGIANGMIRPLSHVVYSFADVRNAFRLIFHSNHIGRVLIKIKETDTKIIRASVIPRTKYSAESTNLIVCDETEMGIKLANHLIIRGARKLILHLKTNRDSRFIQSQLAKWNKMGASIKISTVDLEEKMNCVKILDGKEKLQGIFIIKPKNQFDSSMFYSAVANLSDVSRNNYPVLEYFVIIARNPKNDRDQDLTTDLVSICYKRVESGLPALMIQAEIENNEANKNQSKMRPTTVESLYRAMDISLKQNCTNVFGYNRTMIGNELLEKVSKIIGKKLMDAADDDVRVKDLVCSDFTIEELKFVIRENYKLEICTDNIKEMTINSLRNLCNTEAKAKTKYEDGLAAFYNFVDYDIHQATEIFEPIPTLSSSSDAQQNLHSKAINIMLIPGFEGHHNIYKSMCDSLKMRATVLQLGPDQSKESIRDIALNLKQLMKTRFQLKPKFYLLGYSFGLNVALELASLLEKDGHVGVIYCLDSSPDALRAQLDAYLGDLSEEQLQNAVIEHMYHLMSGTTNYNFREEIEKSKDWDERVTICIEKLNKYVTISNEYKKDIINTLYKRICLAKSYKPQLKLESDIVLLKGIPHPKAVKLDDDYGLSKYTRNPVRMFHINSDVAVAPYDSKVPNIVNKLLEPALLKEFKNKNHCEVYHCK